MAISKILYMKDTGKSFHGKHLKGSLEYVLNPEKTQDGRFVGAVNCQAEYAFNQMKRTKKKFGKLDKRQGYHLLLAFQQGELTPDTAFEIAEKFVKEYLGDRYETVFCVHDNTEHVHAHIIFNSVSFLDGKKYRYEKGDWAREIQPITNRLCEEYGISTLNIEEMDHEKTNRSSSKYGEWKEQGIWSSMIKRDLDACILQAEDFPQFESLLMKKGYEIKHGKHLAIRPPGMRRYRRCRTLGEDYSEEALRSRIGKEWISHYKKQTERKKAGIIPCRVRRYKRAALSGIQKKYYAKLYWIGKLKKRPYSQAWKYQEDIRRLQEFQKRYLFLSRHGIQTMEQLEQAISDLTDKKKEAHADKSRIYRKRQKCKGLFDTVDEMDQYKEAHEAFLQGDYFFHEEECLWNRSAEKLTEQGYSYDEVCGLRTYYKGLIAECVAKERDVVRELRTAEAILKDLYSTEDGVFKDHDGERGQDRRKEEIRNRETKQPEHEEAAFLLGNGGR